MMSRRTTSERPLNQDEPSLHPFWLGLLILFSVVIVLCFLYCLKKKFASIFSSFFQRKNTAHDLSCDETHFSYQWPPIYRVPVPSPKLYRLVKTMKNLQSEQHLHLKPSNIERESKKFNDPPTILVYDCSPISKKSYCASVRLAQRPQSEVARKFYASMRNTSQCENSQSFESVSEILSSHDENAPYPHTPEFFQVMPRIDSVTLNI